jgi:hypothetical protein
MPEKMNLICPTNSRKDLKCWKLVEKMRPVTIKTKNILSYSAIQKAQSKVAPFLFHRGLLLLNILSQLMGKFVLK